MARANGRQDADMREQLLSEGQRFSFVQAFRFLRNLLYEEMGPEANEQDVLKRIRVRPELSLAFPETDIVSIEELSGDPSRFLITATFLGLYGTSSPLPTFYTEDLLQEKAQDLSISRDFIDIFNTCVYLLYFRAWGRHRLFYKLVEEQDQAVLERLYCVLGLGGDILREGVKNPYAMLRYTGLMTQFPRSAEGLRAILADGLFNQDCHVVQFVERTVDIPQEQRFALGISGNRLGENAYLGVEITERMGKFRISVGPLSSEDFDRFLPDKPAFDDLKTLVRFYLDQPLAWDLEAVLLPEETATTRLGEPIWSRLGWNTWLFSDGYMPENTAVRFEGQDEMTYRASWRQ